MVVKIYDEQKLEDILITGAHGCENNISYLRVEGHNLVSIGLSNYDDAIDNPELKKELLEHPDRFTLDGKPITEIVVSRYYVDTEENGDEVFQIQIGLFN